MLRGSILKSAIQIGNVSGTFEAPLFDAFSRISQNARSISGLARTFRIGAPIESPVGAKIPNVGPLSAINFRRYIHSGKVAEDESGKFPFGGLSFPQELALDRGAGMTGRQMFYQPPVESNADVVHIKLMRNNAFVTLTDSKGNKKIGISAGKLAGKVGKMGRYSGEAAAEDIGRRVRQMKTRSVVVKVNGRCMFRRKKDAILAFKDGYTSSRVDMNHPIVYLEDTTRKPHNGCRLPKKRRI